MGEVTNKLHYRVSAVEEVRLYFAKQRHYTAIKAGIPSNAVPSSRIFLLPHGWAFLNGLSSCFEGEELAAVENSGTPRA